ncbi:MAG: hypothetical protein RIE06_23920 [Roseibium album]|uniref:hypothetical protein n=1 Tax=Roseibium album TaxID=311410 RepID=UPI0018C98664|nr:hypothetical protein [Labrenzia sp. EL_13]
MKVTDPNPFHDEALRNLQNNVEAGVSPIDTLANIAISHVKIAGFKVQTAPELQQRFVGIFSAEDETRGEYSFILKSAKTA